MLTRLMFPSRSIWPPDRKNTSTRPCPAQSNSSRPPSVKKECRRLPSSDTYGRPLPSARAVRAAVAGIGDALPTATWRASPIRRTITPARSSSSRRGSGGALRMHVLFEIADEAVGGGAEAGIFGEVGGIRRIVIGEAQRPGAARRHRHGLHVEARERAGGQPGIVEQVA